MVQLPRRDYWISGFAGMTRQFVAAALGKSAAVAVTRWSVLATLVLLFAAVPARAESFTEFLHAFEPKAVAAGVSPAIYERATAGLTPDPDIPKLITNQPEFSQPIWDYIDIAASATRIAHGKAAMAANAVLFKRIGKTYGVDPYLLGAIWGIETNYGSVLSSKSLIRPIIRSLATLVFERRARLAMDEADFIAALKLVQQGPLNEDTLVGSWAGAIGHLQVNPASVVKYGQDGDGDGKIDLDHSLPDALATTANFLRGLGYQPGLDWGYEVTLPPGFDYLLADRDNPHPVKFFADLGVRRANGRPFPDAGTQVFLYLPAGKTGPKFLMTPNYVVLKGYNFSDSYALAVAHLADRLKGSDDFVAPWPRSTKFPNLAQRRAMQAALVKLGLLDGPSDGRLGPLTQRAYAKFQAAHGEVADGFLTLDAYEELMAAANGSSPPRPAPPPVRQ
jgi:membrane-bound lytic murein transglycosylase B